MYSICVEEIPNILGPGVYDKLTASVFFLVDNEKSPIGTGFIVSSDLAITVAHNFKDDQGNIFAEEGTEVQGHFGRPHLDRVCKLKVDLLDFVNDVCVLSRSGNSSDPFDNFLHPAMESLQAGTECILAAFQIGIDNNIADLDTRHSVGVFKGAISKAHERHFIYNCPTFAGDSGGAVILRNGNVLGVHIETVYQAKERLRLTTVDGDTSTLQEVNIRLKEVEASVDSLTSALASGAVGISISSVLAAYRATEAKKLAIEGGQVNLLNRDKKSS